MIMFVFQDAHKVSDNWHDGGGLMVIAATRKDAQAIIDDTDDVEVSEHDWNHVREYFLNDNFDYEEDLIAFPDAGCC